MKNRKLIILLLTVAVVIVTGVYTYPSLKKAYVGDTVNVLVAKSDIGDGMILSEDMFVEKEMPAEYVSSVEEYVTKEELKTDKFAKQIILRGEPLIHRKMTSDDEIGLYAEQNLIAVSIESLASSVGAKLAVGDHVTIRGFLESDEGEKKVEAPENLRNIEIAYIIDANAKDKKDSDGEKEETKEGEKFIPKSIVFKVRNEPQAQELIRLEYTSRIHLERLSELQTKKYEEERLKQEAEQKKIEEEQKKVEVAQ